MKIPESIRKKYAPGQPDPEADFFLDMFDEPSGLQVLEVGSHDAPIATMLAECGNDVLGVDLRPYDQQHTKHWHWQADWCNMPDSFWFSWRGKFDVAVSVSAIEHFGLGTYEGSICNPYMDVIAMKLIYDALKPSGVAYISVPIGGRYGQLGTHWRVYDKVSISERIVQGNTLLRFDTRICEAFKLEDKVFKIGDAHTFEDIEMNVCGFPGINALLKIRKRGKSD